MFPDPLVIPPCLGFPFSIKAKKSLKTPALAVAGRIDPTIRIREIKETAARADRALRYFTPR